MLRKIRVLHVLHAFSAGGLENGVVNIINRSPDRFIHELCLLSKSGEFIERLTHPVVVHEMNKKTGNSLDIVFRLRQLFRTLDVDIIHTRNWAAFDGVVAACLTSKPALIHGEHGRDVSDPRGEVFRRNIARRLLSFRASKYVAVSKDLYTWLTNTVRIPTNKLAFIPNGVDTERFSPGRDLRFRKELGIGDEEFVVGAVGRLDPVKDHQGLIRSVQLLQQSGRPVRLIIAGDGPLRAEIDSQLRVAQLAPDAIMLGYRPDVERLYRLFDAFVLNSVAEGMSNTLLEAMASALPIVCTAVGGNVELITDKVHGLVVLPGDRQALTAALMHLIESPRARNSLAANARSFVLEHFSVGRMIEQYTHLYNSVANR